MPFLLVISVLAQPEAPLWGAAWDDLRFPVSAFRLGGSNPPANVQINDNGAGSAGTYALEFEDQAVNEEQIWGIAQMPHSWREGSAVGFHVHWVLEDTTSCNVRWCVEYEVLGIGDAPPANTTTDCVDAASGGTAAQQLDDVESIDMTGGTISDLIAFRLYRNSSHANDTCNGKDAWLYTADIHYQIDRPGSRLELTK